MKLTPKQEAFCIAYAVDKLTQRQAYKKAYNPKTMSDKTMDEKASRLLKSDKVRARIKEIQSEMMNKAIWTKEQMVNDLYDLYKESTEVSFDPSARNVAVKAAKLVSELYGYKIDKVELSTKDTSGIKISFVNKSKTAKKEVDPKIATEYTPPIGVDDGN